MKTLLKISVVLLVVLMAAGCTEKKRSGAGELGKTQKVEDVQSYDAEYEDDPISYVLGIDDEEDTTVHESLNDIRFEGWTDEDWLNNDYIRELRNYINAYNAGEIENEELDQYSDVMKGKFMIGDISPSLVGGVFITFMFIDNPQYVFQSSVYSEVDEEARTVSDYYVVSIGCAGDDLDITTEEVLQTMKEYPELIAW